MTELVQSAEKFTCSDGFQMSARVSRPEAFGKVPGLLFIYEAFGMGEEMFRVADEIAAEGYAVMIPDLLTRGSWFSCIRKIMKEMNSGEGRNVQDLIEARHWLAKQEYVDGGRIGVMGLCMGGAFALILGKTGLFKVSAPFYGQVPKQLDGICPVVASYGARDKRLVADGERLEKDLIALGVAHDYKMYPDAGHGFMNRPANWFVGLVGPALVNARYEPAVAADAKWRMLSFLKLHL